MIRPAAIAAGAVAACAPLVAIVAYFSSWDSDLLIRAAAFVPLLALAGVLGVLLFAGARAWAAAGAAAVLTVAALATQAPLYLGGGPEPEPGAHPAEATVLQANLMLGEADPGAVVALVREHDVDLLAVEELTDTAVGRLREAGLDTVLPYHVLAPRPDGGGGTGVYSAEPIASSSRLQGFAMENIVARTGAGGVPVDFVAVHPLAPYPYPSSRWAGELQSLGDTLQALTERGGPVVVAGDFNAAYSHRQFRALLRGGLADAADAADAGLLPTYPADRWFPPLIGIDHVLVSGVRVDGIEAVDLPGSDHRGLIATLTVPEAPLPQGPAPAGG